MSPRIETTMDYDLFELHDFNRDVVKIKNLTSSMRTHGWIDAYPIHAIRNGNKKFKIKAGHHRYVVAKELRVPLKYVVCNDNATIPELERATNPWRLADYLISRVRSGDPHYLAVKQYMDRTGITLQQCISLLGGESAGSHNKQEPFKDGKFTLGDRTHADIVADIIVHCRSCGIPVATLSLFVNAVSKMAWIPEFNPAVFKQKVTNFKSLVQKQPTAQAYLELIEAIYNRQSKAKKPLAFLADEAAKKRSAVPK
jgi:hypothetical protein